MSARQKSATVPVRITGSPLYVVTTILVPSSGSPRWFLMKKSSPRSALLRVASVNLSRLRLQMLQRTPACLTWLSLVSSIPEMKSYAYLKLPSGSCWFMIYMPAASIASSSASGVISGRFSCCSCQTLQDA